MSQREPRPPADPHQPRHPAGEPQRAGPALWGWMLFFAALAVAIALFFIYTPR